jgi:guanylate kinase
MKTNSFIVTGPSGSGKTTLTRAAGEQGYRTLPTHTTRLLRSGETQGSDMFNISIEDFVGRFEEGDYLEPDLEFALLHSTGVYYGTPKTWLGDLESAKSCAMPVSLTIARKITQSIQVPWVHLECSDEVRRERLLRRGISEVEIDARLNTGESIFTPSEATIILNSAELATGALLTVIEKGINHE